MVGKGGEGLQIPAVSFGSEIKVNCARRPDQQLMLGLLCMVSGRQKAPEDVPSKNKINR